MQSRLNHFTFGAVFAAWAVVSTLLLLATFVWHTHSQFWLADLTTWAHTALAVLILGMSAILQELASRHHQFGRLVAVVAMLWWSCAGIAIMFLPVGVAYSQNSMLDLYFNFHQNGVLIQGLTILSCAAMAILCLRSFNGRSSFRSIFSNWAAWFIGAEQVTSQPSGSESGSTVVPLVQEPSTAAD